MINSETYEPTRSEACFEYSGCPVLLQGKCPLYAKKETEKLVRSDSIEDRVNAYKKLEIDLKVLKSSITEYFKYHAIENINSKPVGYAPTFSYRYNLNKFMKYCMERKIPLGDLTLSKTDAEGTISRFFKKVTRMDEDELNELKGMQVDTATNKFSI